MLDDSNHGAIATLDALGIGATDSLGLSGAGIAIGLPDYGFDVLHPALRAAASGTTRFTALLDQAGSGRVLDRAAIDDLISSARQRGNREPVDAVYDPHANYYGRHGVIGGAHGTHMATIAAGSRVGNHRGVAPGAELIGVHLDLPDHAWKEERCDGTPSWLDWARGADPTFDGWKSYEDCAAIVRALGFIHERACRQRAPGLVVNVSVGTWAGAHDGASQVDTALADLASRTRSSAQEPACAVVVAAGNAGDDRGHYSGIATSAVPSQFAWSMDAGDRSQNKLEIWYEANSGATVRLTDGSQSQVFDIAPGPTYRLAVDGAIVGIADHTPRARGKLSRVRILLHPPLFPASMRGSPPNAPASICWTIAIAPRSAQETARIEAWVERDDGYPVRSKLHPNAQEGTLCAFACAPGVIVVGGYDASIPGRCAPFPLSSRGPLPWVCRAAEHVPQVLAPAHEIAGAVSKTGGYSRSSGTSAAAALTSGLVALLMEQQWRAAGAIEVATIRRQLLACTQPDNSARGGAGRVRFPMRVSETPRERVAAH